MNNFYYLTGRKKRISKLFGLRINLDDIEKFLKKRKLDTKIVINDDKISVVSKNNSDHKKIKDQIFDKFKINKNFIEVSNNINEKKITNFKK